MQAKEAYKGSGDADTIKTFLTALQDKHIVFKLVSKRNTF